MEISSDGYFLDLWSHNQHGETVFPYVKTKKGGGKEGLDVTPTTAKSDYRLMDLEEFLSLLSRGDFLEQGRIQMRPRDVEAKGRKGGGFRISKSLMSEKLHEEIRRRQSS